MGGRNPAGELTGVGRAQFVHAAVVDRLQVPDPTPDGGPWGNSGGSHAGIRGGAGPHFYFTARGYLFRSDGTPPGTYPLLRQYSTDPQCTAALGAVFFSCVSGLVRSDGSVAGTKVLSSSAPAHGRLAVLAGKVYFDGGGGQGVALWRTDGTLPGTVPFATFDTGGAPIGNLAATSDRLFFTATRGGQSGLFVSNGGPDPPAFLGAHTIVEARAAGHRYFFVAIQLDGTSGLWVVDGSRTLLLRTFTPVERAPRALTALGGRVLFEGGDASHGREPWISDGSTEGTRMLLDVEPGPTQAFLAAFEILGNAGYFLNRGSLWRTDGSPAGTFRVKESFSAVSFLATPSRLLIRSLVAGAPQETRLWVSDGTLAGTLLVHSNRSVERLEAAGVELSGRLFFALSTSRYGQEIWQTNGTIEGTGIFVDLESGTYGDGITSMAAGSTRAFFNHANGGFWSTDGTAGGTQAVTKGGVPVEAGVATVIAVGDIGYSCGWAGLWRTDVTDAGTFQVSPSGYACAWVVRAGDRFFFQLSRPGGAWSLWQSDGTAGNATLVRDLDFVPGLAVALGDRILFIGWSPAEGIEPWVSDGTSEGTHVLKDVVPGPSLGIGAAFVVAGTSAYFLGGGAYDELWQTDGTEAGTVRMAIDDSRVKALAAEPAGLLYFFSEDSGGTSLWRSDGTAEGTVRFKTFASGYFSGGGSAGPVASAGRLFFQRHDAGETWLWSSDGTPAGTTPLREGNLDQLTGVPGGLAFAPSRGIAFTDGTVLGTRLLGAADVDSFTNFVRLGSMLLFSARDLAHGRELWRADLEGGGGLFYTLVPCRVVDTRTAADGPAMVGEYARPIQVAGRGGGPVRGCAPLQGAPAPFRPVGVAVVD